MEWELVEYSVFVLCIGAQYPVLIDDRLKVVQQQDGATVCLASSLSLRVFRINFVNPIFYILDFLAWDYVLNYRHQIFFEIRLCSNPMFVDFVNIPAHTYQITDIVIQFHVVEPLLQGLEYFPYFFPNSADGLCQRSSIPFLYVKVVVEIAECPEFIGCIFLIPTSQQIISKT